MGNKAMVKEYIKAISKRWKVTIALHDHINNTKLRTVVDVMLLPFAWLNYMLTNKNVEEYSGGGGQYCCDYKK